MSHVKDRDKNQILEEMVGTARPDSPVFEQQRSAIIVRCTEDLEKSISQINDAIVGSSKENQKLNKRLFWLNFLIATATIVGVVIKVIELSKK